MNINTPKIHKSFKFHKWMKNKAWISTGGLFDFWEKNGKKKWKKEFFLDRKLERIREGRNEVIDRAVKRCGGSKNGKEINVLTSGIKEE